MNLSVSTQAMVEALINSLEKAVQPKAFASWLAPLHWRLEHSTLIIEAPNSFVLKWVKEHYQRKIREVALQTLGFLPQIEFIVVERILVEETPSQEKNHKTPRKKNKALNPLLTFETFVPGKANQLARAAALQVAENPGVAYNPLFIYGGVGLGKTHLIQAIGNSILEKNQDSKVSYLHAERFVADVVRAYQQKSFEQFKDFYRTLDLLLIDDIQFFAGKNRTQEEFFYAFNALLDNKKQLVVTCDTFPKDLQGIEERLISRFSWGLTVGIDPPELELRVAILHEKSKQLSMILSDEVAFFIAKMIRANVRELEGALKRVKALAKFSGHPISMVLAKEALKDLIAANRRQVSIENIQKTVADYYKIRMSDFFSKSRARAFSRPRQLAMALTKELTTLSYPEIGEAFGGKDHTTVLHACRKIKEIIEKDSKLSKDWQILLQVLAG
jgi:chromosomal replication initiator protein